MTTKPDIAAQLEHLVRVGRTPGCTVWLCMVTDTLARAARELRKLQGETQDQPGPDPIEHDDQLALFGDPVENAGL